MAMILRLMMGIMRFKGVLPDCKTFVYHIFIMQMSNLLYERNGGLRGK